MIRFSVIIPTLNEEDRVGGCIDAVHGIDPDVEIIVSDGGSTDRTLEVALGRGAKVCNGLKGRGTQMNAGAAIATGDVLVFLHADTLLPTRAFHQLAIQFSDRKTKIGVFRLKFDARHFLLGLLERLSAVRPFWFRFGDASITVRRDFFMSLGGFPNQPLFEDLEFLHKASLKAPVTLFPFCITTSSRRFLENGIARQLFRNILFTVRYFAGSSPLTLAAEYERRNRRLERRSLLMMVRYPEPGRVKSRLANDLGEKPAAEIYRFCAESLFRAATSLPEDIDNFLYCADESDCDRISSWAGGKFGYLAQPEGELADRLIEGFELAFDQGATKVIIVASDVPDIRSELIQRAFNALNQKDVVIGPSPDGGYYLIGLNNLHPGLFRDIRWSTRAVLRETLQNAKTSHLSVVLLPQLQDIDTAEDWVKWRACSLNDSAMFRSKGEAGEQYAAT